MTGEPTRAEVEEMLAEQHRVSMASVTRYTAAAGGGGRYGDAVLAGRIAEIAARRAGGGICGRRALATLLSRRWAPAVLAAALAVELACFATDISLIVGSGSITGRQFRFTPLETRNGTAAAATADIGGLGLLSGGCENSLSRGDGAAELRSVDGQVMLTMPAAVTVDGWQFTTAPAPSPAGLDPVRFTLERSTYAEEEVVWDLIGASWGAWAWSGHVIWNPAGPAYPTVTARNSTEGFSLGPPMAWAAHRAARGAALIAGIAVLLVTAAAKRHLLTPHALAGLFGVLATLDAAGCAAYAAAAQWPVAVVAGGFAAIELGVVAAGAAQAEGLLVQWGTGAAGAAYWALILTHYLVALQHPAGLASASCLALLHNSGLLEGAALIVLFAAMQLQGHRERRARRVAATAAARDRAAYDAAWANVCQAEGATEAIVELSRLSAEAGRTLPPPRQPLGPAVAVASEPPCGTRAREVGRTADLPLVLRVERLLAQAAGLDVFLRARVRAWGLATGASCSVEGRGFEPWARVAAQGLESRVQWAGPKPVDRALEKLYRCYDLDPTRLLDCCRQVCLALSMARRADGGAGVG